MEYKDLRTIDYGRALDIQNSLFAAHIDSKKENVRSKNTLILCEHLPTITIGKHGKNENLLFSESYLNGQGVSVFKIERGGDVTFHGPGQLVGYPIFDLEIYDMGLRQYIFTIEEIIIRLLAQYNIKSERLEGAAGVWIDTSTPAFTRKICAIGVRSSRYVTMHGFALNVNTDLKYFSLINPCGFIDKGVTTMEKELGHKVDMEEVKEKTRELFEELFIETPK